MYSSSINQSISQHARVRKTYHIDNKGIRPIRAESGVILIGGVFLLRQSALTDLARCVCRSFIRPSVSFFVFNDGLKSSECSDFRRSFQLDSVRVSIPFHSIPFI